MKKIKIHLIAAARPNFMKIAPLYHALKNEGWSEPVIVHTGQHYDLNMSDVFFQDLGLHQPDLNLGVGSGTHAEQTGKVMIEYEKILSDKQPDLVVVVGDVNSTMACTLAATKMVYSVLQGHGQKATDNGHDCRPVTAHLEAGLRSYDRTMPEEINRLVTDSLADILWTPSLDANENLIREGVSTDKIHCVGNIMIDSLEMLREKVQNQSVFRELNLNPGDYGLVTLHRPSNVDDPDTLKKLCELLALISQRIPLVFPIHPRTRKNIQSQGLMLKLKDSDDLIILEPLSYIRFMNLVFNCRFGITDSGGIQEETTYLGLPCLTLRPNTERPITITQGTNRLSKLEDLEKNVDAILSSPKQEPCKIDLWDGHTADRVVQSIKKVFNIQNELRD